MRRSRSIGLTLAVLFLVSCAKSRVSENIPSPPAPAAQAKTEDIVVTGGMVAAPAAPMVNERRFGAIASYAPPPPPPPPAPGMYPTWSPPYHDVGRDKFTNASENPFRPVAEAPVSTFSIDVDTASYSWVRASLNQNVLPQPDSVRTEELVNYFPYDYAPPRTTEQPFSTNVTVFPSPWKAGRKLVRIGIRGYSLNRSTRPRANLVFLIDTSGSMNEPNKLPLVKQSLDMLLGELDPNDKVAIVTYAGYAGTALEPTPAREKTKIEAVIDSLHAGGGTAGGEGIRVAYGLAEANFDPNGVNRVILTTDGDFNIGITNQAELKGYIERERDHGVFLSVLGFGMGNYNDALMQALAQNGNGAAAYIDTLNEARKTLVEESSSTLFPIAKDVKIQVEFNPATVAEYRLIGYETRALNRDDFDNDKVDAGDVGSGQTVTALYEIVPVGGPRTMDALRYSVPEKAVAARAGEYGFVKIRYKLPKSDTSRLISTPIDPRLEVASFSAAPQDARFATAVAGFAELLRGGKYSGTLTYDDVLRMADSARGKDEFGYRAEFVQIVRAAKGARTLAKLEP
jgi:Ca-activated chloride channel family protein